MKKVDVSVLMLAYNHEKYFSQSIESILNQRFDGVYEIIIGEDCSQDKTREIILEYSERFPEKVKPIFREKNIGLIKNFVDTLKNCTGKYVAILSGDDYWISPDKLQHQFEYLEKHENISVYSNNALEYIEDRKEYGVVIKKGGVLTIDVYPLFYSNPVIASQNIFRNLPITFPDIYFDNIGEDRQLWMLLSRFGKIHIDYGYFTGVYRRHSNSITGSSKEDRIKVLRRRLDNNQKWAKYLGIDNDNDYLKGQDIVRRRLLSALIRKWDIRGSIKLAKAFNKDPFNNGMKKIIFQIFKNFPFF